MLRIVEKTQDEKLYIVGESNDGPLKSHRSESIPLRGDDILRRGVRKGSPATKRNQMEIY